MAVALTMEFHEVANIFPLIEGKEFDDLVEDIRANGLQQPIWVYRGKIIDGRNRYRACMKAGVEPRYQEWDGNGSLVAFSVSLNIKRRHLTSSQLAVIALGVEKQIAKEAEEVKRQTVLQKIAKPSSEMPVKHQLHAAAKAARLLGTNHDYVSAAKKVEQDAPKLLSHVMDGTLSISDARAIATLPEDRQAVVVGKAIHAREEEGRRISSVVRSAIQDEIGEKSLKDINTLRVMGSSDSPEWYTPQEIIALALDCLGSIDLDPCSNSHESPTVPSKARFTRKENGLIQTWHGKVYMNPPYGGEIPNWIDKLVHEYEQMRVEEAVALLPARIDTVWFQPLYQYPMCNVRGRIQFANSPYHAPFPCVVVYLGEHTERFIECFRDLGPIMRRIG